MYEIEITYDTGDSFNHYSDLSHTIGELKWKSLPKAKKALKDIQNHYKWYMIMNNEWNAGKEDRDKANRYAKKSKWYDNKFPEFKLHLENDKGERVSIYSCWTGYFESLVGADIVTAEDKSMSFRI